MGRYCKGKQVSWQIQSIRNSFGQQQGLPFADLLTPELLRTFAGGVTRSVEPIYTPLVTLWMFLGQVLDPDHSCRRAVACLLAWLTMQGQPACASATGAYCKARNRLPEEPLYRLVEATGDRLHCQAKQKWLWKGRRVKVVDGTTVIMPDSKANQAEYPQPDGQKSGLGFPMIRMAAMFCLTTGAVLAAAVADRWDTTIIWSFGKSRRVPNGSIDKCTGRCQGNWKFAKSKWRSAAKVFAPCS